jgi:hypothetical protein
MVLARAFRGHSRSGIRPAACAPASLASVPLARIPAISACVRLLALAVIAGIAAGCSGAIGATPRPTAADFEGLVGGLHTRGISVADVRSGDPGCDDPNMVAPAISFHAAGLDQPEPVLVRLYIFRNRDAYDRRRADVDACARAFVTDPSSFEALDAPPFVAVGAGPWGTAFRDAFRATLIEGSGAAPGSPSPGASSS